MAGSDSMTDFSVYESRGVDSVFLCLEVHGDLVGQRFVL